MMSRVRGVALNNNYACACPVVEVCTPAARFASLES